VPEGHTVRRDARRLGERFAGSPVVVSSPQGRFEEGAALLDGRTMVATDAHGKHLLADFDDGRTLHVHLGLYGKWTTGDGVPEAPRGQVRVRLEGERGWADLRGPTACEVLDPEGVDALHARLGEDPLRADADPAVAWARVHRSRSSTAGLLMQQEVVAGVGVVYRAEVLFRAGINPYRPGRELQEGEWDALWSDLVTLMAAGVRAGRIVTTRPEHRTRRSGRPTRADAFYVYRRQGQSCRVCGTEIAYAQLAARNLTWCPSCQPE
jgi:DNA-formamidopyrimidine glycosylase